MNHKIKTGILILCGVVSALISIRPLTAADRTLWELGKFDQSSIEFKGHGDLSSPQYNPVVTIGKGDPTQDWPAGQPGSATKHTGSRPHPYTILFKLDGPPKGVYRLDVSVILSRSRVPALQVELNGKSGIFYFHRRVSYYPGDFGADSPIFGADRQQFELPTRLFKLGENKLVLTAVDDPKEGEGDS